MSYLSDVWYCIALSTEPTSEPMRRVICELPIVIFRTESGKVAAMEDRCAHRQAPLSMGHVIGEEIQCNYHGLVFDCSGKCTHVPSQERAPRSASIRAFEVVERWGYVWMWWGDAGAANPDLIPEIPWVYDAGFRTNYFYFYANANHQLMADNLLDVSHTDFLHRHGIGSKAGAKGQKNAPVVELESRIEGEIVYSLRVVRNTGLGPTAQAWAGTTKPVDRTSRQRWEKPNTIHFKTTFENDESSACLRMEHMMTPESATSTHYFMNWTRDFGLDNVNYPTDDDVHREQTQVVTTEDIPMVEAQQANILKFPDKSDVAARQDQFVGNVHRALYNIYKEAGLEIPPEIERTIAVRP